MRNVLVGIVDLVLKVAVLGVLPLFLAAVIGLGRFAAFTVLPVLGLVVLALVSGLVRTTALGAFGVVALLKVLMVALDRLEEAAPTPRLSWEVAR